MPDRAPITERWTRAQITTRMLRDELRAIGLHDDEVRQVLPAVDSKDRPYIRLGIVSVDSADRILAALTGRGTPTPEVES